MKKNTENQELKTPLGQQMEKQLRLLPCALLKLGSCLKGISDLYADTCL